MASTKHTLTQIFLKQAGLPVTEDSVRKSLFKWWKNPRDKKEGGLALTDEGLDHLAVKLGLKYYEIPFPKDFEFTTQIVLFLDQFIDCPNYYTKKAILVFNEKKAAELMLFSGDVRKYGVAKAMARQRDLNA
jgi:hypothetical protein